MHLLDSFLVAPYVFVTAIDKALIFNVICELLAPCWRQGECVSS